MSDDEKEEVCVCCSLSSQAALQADEFFVVGLSFGIMYLAEGLPLRICEEHTKMCLSFNLTLRKQYEEVNGHSLAVKAAAVRTAVDGVPKGPLN